MPTSDFSFFRPKNAELVAEPAAVSSVAAGEASARPQISLVAGWLSDVGRARELNEDALFALTTEFQQGDQIHAIGVFAVADGMGGYEHGEKASALAIHTAANSLLWNLVTPTLHGERSDVPLFEIMREATLTAHTQVRKQILGAGTTLTLAVIVENSLAVTFVGDTRAYLYADGQLKQITIDHTLAQRLTDIGQPISAETMSNLSRSLLLRALGQSEELEVDFHFGAFESGHRLLICSDGLWGYVAHESLERLVREATEPQVACQELIRLANAAGGPDNITAILVVAR
jgi:protein phosphatase